MLTSPAAIPSCRCTVATSTGGGTKARSIASTPPGPERPPGLAGDRFASLAHVALTSRSRREPPNSQTPLRHPQRRDARHVDRPLGVPQVIGDLQAQPHARAVAAKPADPERHLGRDRGPPRQDAVPRVSGDAEIARRRRNRSPESGQHMLAQDLPQGKRAVGPGRGARRHPPWRSSRSTSTASSPSTPKVMRQSRKTTIENRPARSPVSA